MIAIFIFGVASYRLLPVNGLPSADFPALQVDASLPGAAGETVVVDGQLRLTPGAVVESKEKQAGEGKKE